MSAVKLESLEKRFGSGEPVVKHLAMEIEEGEFVCLLGPSGCGKTTTLRMIAGLEQPTGGVISSRDRVLSSARDRLFVPPEKRGFGLVFQSYALWPHLTVAKNIEFGLRLRKVGKVERVTRVKELASMLRIEGLEERYPSELSGGQQQRVALARMLAINPGILLLDEPLSNLDAALRLEMRTELKRIHEELDNTIVFVTHDQLEAMTLATKIAVMNKGELQQYAGPMDVYLRPANRFVAEFVGSPPMAMFVADVGHSQLASSVLETLARSDSTSDVSTIGIRPESFQLSSDASVAAGWDWYADATIVAVLPTGVSWLVNVESGDDTFFAQVFEPPTFDVGDRVFVGSTRADLHLFDAGGQRI